jgi:hypothetical protein
MATTDFVNFEELVARIEGDCETYLTLLFQTLQISKIEAQFQRYNKPPIYFKKIDDIGLIVEATLNPDYQGRVPEPLFIMREEQKREWLDLIFSPANMAAVNTLLVANGAETKEWDKNPIYAQEKLPAPYFVRTFDADGLPNGFGINKFLNELDW